MRMMQKIMVAGFDHYQKELSSLMTDENDYYNLTKAEMLDETWLDPEEKIYKYEVAHCALAIKHEPGNPYDPAALRVHADGQFIGYVPRKQFQLLKRLAYAPGLEMHVEIFGGPYKILEYNEEEDYLGEMLPKYYTLRSEKDQFKAIMIFKYDA